MNRSALVGHLLEIEAFLKSDGRFLLPPEELTVFSRTTAEVREKAQTPAEVLYVAIAGGTGVGKSTLINALARQEISRASDRRPYTDRAVVYRHKDTEQGLANLALLIRQPDAVHGSDGARDLVLLDLPDFDSKDESNRRTVREILPSMDCVIWVTSPEKYADAVLYDLVREIAKDQENFTFVLNKADQLVVKGQPDPLARLKEVVGDLTLRLKHESGVLQPRMFSLSAADEFQGLTDDAFLTREFQRFREFLMTKRDAKEIASAKTRNLVEETRRLLKDLMISVRPLEGFATREKGGDGGRQESLEHPRPAVGTSVEAERRLAEELYRCLTAAEASVAPVTQALRFFGRGRSGASERSVESSFKEMAGMVAKDRITELHRDAARSDSEILLALRGTEAVKQLREPELTLDEAVSQAFRDFIEKVAKKKKFLAGPLSAWRRWWQRCVLFVPLLLLCLKLAGLNRVEAWLNSPSVGGALGLALSVLTSLFGSEGLVGLIALLICEILLVLYIAARRNTAIRKMAHQLSREGIAYVDAATDAAARTVQAERLETIRKVGQGVENLNNLASRFDLQRVSSGATSWT